MKMQRINQIIWHKKTLKNYKGLKKKKFIKEGVYEKKFSHLLNCYKIFHLKSYRYGV